MIHLITFKVFNLYVKPVLKLNNLLTDKSVKSTNVRGWNVN